MQSGRTGKATKRSASLVGRAALLFPDILSILDLLEVFVFEFRAGLFTREVGVVELHDFGVDLARFLIVGVGRSNDLGDCILEGLGRTGKVICFLFPALPFFLPEFSTL